MSFNGTHWVTLFVGMALGYLVLPFLMSFFTGRGKLGG